MGGAILVLPVLVFFSDFVILASQALYSKTSAARMIANTHLFFNVGNTVIWLALLPFLVWLTRKIIPDLPETERRAFQVKYLDEKLLSTPVAAIDAARKEVVRMTGYALDFVEHSLELYELKHAGRIKGVKDEDEKIDLMESEIVKYLARIAQSDLAPRESDEVMQLLNVANEVENMCDVVVKNLAKKAEKMMLEKKVLFSNEGWEEIKGYHKLVLEKIQEAIDAFRENRPELALEVLKAEEVIIDWEVQLRRRHLERLVSENPESLETSQFHMDTLYNIRRLFQHAVNICRLILSSEERQT